MSNSVPLSRFSAPTQDEWIEILDAILDQPKFSAYLKEHSLSAQPGIATSFVQELESLNVADKAVLLNALAPHTIDNLASQQHTLGGLRQFSEFAKLLDEQSKDPSKPAEAIISSIQLNMETYFFCVYIRESLIRSILSLQKTHHQFAITKAARALLDGRIRLLRNSFSHAAWCIEHQNGPEFVGWNHKTKQETLRMPDDEWNFLRLLAFAITAAAVKAF